MMAHLRTQQLLPAGRLNNKGVLLLNLGRYNDAARCFSMASKMTRSAISASSSKQEAQGYGIETDDVDHGSLLTTNAAASEEAYMSTNNDILVPPRPQPALRRLEEPSCAAELPARKRRKKQSKEPNSDVLSGARLCVLTPPVPHALGRPLWMQSKRDAPLDPLSFSASLMYNLGLCFHLKAIRCEQHHQNDQQTQQMYSKPWIYTL